MSATTMPKIEFWYDFASTYSYLSVMRIEALARAAGVEVAWRPFLLGPIFQAQGWSTSPFNVYPAKGRYMVRDIERIATARGLPFTMPAVFPANSLGISRLALALEPTGLVPAATRAVFQAQFGRGDDIADHATWRRTLSPLVGREKLTEFVAAASGEELKQALRRRTEEAVLKGVFGAPSFVAADGEVFWGDDRLEQALLWARNGVVLET